MNQPMTSHELAHALLERPDSEVAISLRFPLLGTLEVYPRRVEDWTHVEEGVVIVAGGHTTEDTP